MKIIKSLFLISLFSFIIMGAVVLAFKSHQKTVTNISVLATPGVADNRCIVTVDGVKYDVTQFRNQHSGGDIFQCGTDMSAIFHGQHSNSYLQKMQQYRI